MEVVFVIKGGKEMKQQIMLVLIRYGKRFCHLKQLFLISWLQMS